MAKTCKKCNATFDRPEEAFGKDKSRKDGLNLYCKKCCKAARDAKKEQVNAARRKKYREDPVYAENIRKKVGEYRDANPDTIKARKKRYREANADKIRLKKKEHYQENAEHIKAKSRKWREENPERLRQQRKTYRQENLESIKEKDKAYKRNNKEKIRAHWQNRRARKAAAPGHFSDEQWLARLAYYGHKCIYCGSSEDIQIEHRIPLSREGSNWPANLAPACKSCNCSKGTKTESEFKIQLAIQTYSNETVPEHLGA